MKALIILMECLAASAVVTFILTDEWWQNTIGILIFVCVLALAFAGFFIHGYMMAERKSELDKGLQFRLGEQTGKNRKW